MTHFARTQNDATWVNGYTVTPADLADLDAKTFKAINGDDGGTWTPSAVISIAGSGLRVTGPLRIRGQKFASSAQISTIIGSRVKLGDGDFPILAPGHAGQTRTLLTPCLRAAAKPRGNNTLRFEFYAPQLVATNFSGLFGGGPGKLYVPLRVHNGGLITRATVTFRVGQPHDFVPTMPKVRILRADQGGDTVPMSSVAAGADASGYVSYSPAPSSGSGWYDGGALKSLVVPCDQNNLVDNVAYTYVAEIVEESGGVDPFTVPTVLDCVLVADSNIALSGSPSTIDNVNISSGKRVLVTGQSNATQNGMYLTSGAGWTRTTDFDTAAKMVHHSMVYITAGSLYRDTVWWLQNKQPITLGTTLLFWNYAGSDDDTGNQTAYGSIWHTVALRHEGIPDMRFQ